MTDLVMLIIFVEFGRPWLWNPTQTEKVTYLPVDITGAFVKMRNRIGILK